MNLSKLGYSSWIIIINVILILALIIRIFLPLFTTQYDTYINYIHQVDPTVEIDSTVSSEIATANNSYASLLMYIKNNPSKSAKFIADIKDKFFNDNCTVKSDIDFGNIAQFKGGMPFS
jgi:hypothetical protein